MLIGILKKKKYALLLIASLIVTLFSSFTDVYALTDRYTFFQLINNSRAASGLGLLAPNTALDFAAQQHAEEMAVSGEFTHFGRNGSTVEERVKSAGYTSYPDGVLVAQSWTTGHVEQAFSTLLNQSVDSNHIHSINWREVGIGTAQTGSGTQIWVIVFGAQPGILPIFINHNQEVTHERTVRIQLHNETITQNQSPFGYPVEMRIAEEALLSEASWQAWQPEVQFELSPGDGLKKVIVQLRDTEARLVDAWDTITLDEAEYFVLSSVEDEARIDSTPTQVVRTTNIPTPAATSSASPTIVVLDNWNIATPIVLLWPTPSPSSLDLDELSTSEDSQPISSPTVSADVALNVQADLAAEPTASPDQGTPTPIATITQTTTPTSVPIQTETLTFANEPSPAPAAEPTMGFVESTPFVPASIISSPTIQLYEMDEVAVEPTATKPLIFTEATKSITLTAIPTFEVTATKDDLLAVAVSATAMPTFTPINQTPTPISSYSEPNPTETTIPLLAKTDFSAAAAAPASSASASSSLFSRETIKRAVRVVTLLIIELVVLFAIARLLFLGMMLRR